MSNFKEWFSDNLRYFVLFLVLIVVLVGGFFGARAIYHIGGAGSGNTPKQKETEAKQTEATTEASTDVIVTQNTDGLVQNDTKVLTMMTSYYTAKTNKDIETLVKLDPSMNQAEEIENLENTYVESYSNIKTYSKVGPDTSSCVVYVCYDGKVRDIDTLVPSLVQFFLKTNTEGNYYISDASEDNAASEFVEETKKSSEVQELITQVNAACEAAKESDPDLKEFMNKYAGSSSNDSKDEKEPKKDSGKKQNTKEEKVWMIAIDSCNVRAGAGTDAEVVGSLSYGDEVEAFGESEKGWYKILYNDEEAYVSADFIVAEDEFDGVTPPEEEEAAEYAEYSEYDEYYDPYADSYYGEVQY